MSDGMDCPVCREKGFQTRMERLDIAHFDTVIQLTYTCEACGFRRSDMHIEKQEDPMRYQLDLIEERHLSVRVVRSASGHFEIPELNIRAEPGQAADAFVTNAEGVLERCISAIRTALRGAESEAQRSKAEALLEKADRMRSLDVEWSLVIEDPMGNSAILSDDAARTPLSEGEVESLGTPYPVVELDESVDPEDAVPR